MIQKLSQENLEALLEYAANLELQKCPKKVDLSRPIILDMNSIPQKTQLTNMQCIRQFLEMDYIDKVLKNDPEKTKYLSKEYGWKGINIKNMPHYQPKMPKQKGTTDCGLFVLENAEAFL